MRRATASLEEAYVQSTYLPEDRTSLLLADVSLPLLVGFPSGLSETISKDGPCAGSDGVASCRKLSFPPQGHLPDSVRDTVQQSLADNHNKTPGTGCVYQRPRIPMFQILLEFSIGKNSERHDQNLLALRMEILRYIVKCLFQVERPRPYNTANDLWQLSYLSGDLPCRHTVGDTAMMCDAATAQDVLAIATMPPTFVALDSWESKGRLIVEEDQVMVG